MKIFDSKLNRNKVVFKDYFLSELDTCCPECGYILKNDDVIKLHNGSKFTCLKCGAKLKIGKGE